MPTYKDKPYLDGGFSNNQPVLNELCTIRISPFAGGSHISPNDGENEGSNSRPFIKKWGGEVLNLSSTNMKRLYEAMMPPDDLNSLYNAGYEHTDTFLVSSPKFKLFLENFPSQTTDNKEDEST